MSGIPPVLGQPVASAKLSDELMAAIKDSSPLEFDPKTRYCAYCLLPPLEGEEAMACAACKRRIYCSKACQTADWRTPTEGKPGSCGRIKATAYGQGHKNWCAIPCGEEGLDWGLKMVEGGQGQRPGLVALRDIPPLYRILVEGYQNAVELGFMDHPGNLAIIRSCNQMTTGKDKDKVYIKIRKHTVGGRSVFGFRSHFGNHACDANAFLVWDTEFRVLILCSSKEIKKGEEICFQYEFLQFNDISRSPPPNLKEREKELLEALDHVCKPDCICKDQELRRRLLDLWAADDSFVKLMRRGKIQEALPICESLPELAARARLPTQQMAYIDFQRYKMQVSLGLPGSQAVPFVRKIVEFRERVWHPRNKEVVLKYKEMEKFFLQNSEVPIKRYVV